MPLNLIPLGDRVLIRPEERPEQTESGLFVSEHRKPHTAGWVVAVGECAHPRKAETELAANALEFITASSDADCDTICDCADLLRDLVRREPSVKIGDYVLFSWQSGQLFEMDDEKLLIMRETDILAVVEEKVAVNA